MNRRTFLTSSAAAIVGSPVASALLRDRARQASTPRPPRPTPSQLLWQRDELAMFLHFGVNTFTDREWGDGKESPSIFSPGRLDAREWARTAKTAGFRALILTAKHHDGFCLWPSRTTKHSVASSPWRAGGGDLVREFTSACRAEGLRAGLYLSPWDRNSPLYGDSPRYNDQYIDQLRELLTNYGDIHEVWFDGANGEGPNGKRQEYDWPRVWGEVRKLQPRAVMFSDAGPDVRWCGNETGTAGEPNWSMVDPAVVPVPGMSGKHIIQSLQNGDPKGTVWRPAEADTSIRPGWFHHPGEDARVRTVDQLMQLFFRSVGRNAKLLLNVPPTKDGILHPTDVDRLMAFADRRRALFAERVSFSGPKTEQQGTRRTETFTRSRAAMVATIRIEEPIENGQFASSFVVSAQNESDAWSEVARGQTIGYARIVAIKPMNVKQLRLEVDGAQRVALRAFAPPTSTMK